MKQKQTKIINRLSRLEGQIRGIKKMIEADKSCQKVVIQIMAAREACSQIGLEMMKDKVCSSKKVKKEELKTLFKVIK